MASKKVTSTWQERSAYLKDSGFANKEKLPFDQHQFPIDYQQINSEIIYDFEVQHNIYSVTTFYRDIHKLIIWYYVNDQSLVDEKAVLKKAWEINGLTINTYPKELNGNIDIEVKPLTIKAIRQIFENPLQYVVGFNSNAYDLYVASYILASIYHSKHMPEPGELREWNNLLINPIPTIKNDLKYARALKEAGISIPNSGQRMPPYQVSSIFDVLDEQHQQKMRIQGSLHGTVPYINEIEKRLTGTGLHLDMKLLNEKDKDDPSARYTSLKRISAQLGFQIEEPEEVNLSSNGDLTTDQCTNLLAYNASDVLVTTLIYKSSSYQDVLDNREGLLNRFDKSNFFGRLNVNSTSAKFIENVIAPRYQDKLIDQDKIEFFYPVHGKEYEQLQKQIDKDFIGQYVPYISKKERQEYFVNWVRGIWTQTPTGAAYVRENGSLTNMSDSQILLAYNNKMLREPFEKYLYQNILEGHHDRDYLDDKWTKVIRHMKGFEDVTNDLGETHQRYRVKYGEIQEDLLEHARLRFKKFPKEVYNLYSFYRGAESVYEGYGRNRKLVKTARDVALENYIHYYSDVKGLGYEPLTPKDKAEHKKAKPIPPENVYYKFRKDHSVSGIVVQIQVQNQPMVLSYSVGGVHGEVIKQDKYERDHDIVKTFNDTLKIIEANYKDPVDFIDAVLAKKVVPEVAKRLNLNDDKLKSDVKLFTTKKKIGTIYKKAQKVVNPKSYTIPIDMHHAIHVDVDSLYPSMMINLHMFSKWRPEYNDPKNFDKTNRIGHWEDIYAKLRAERIRLKKAANSVPKEDWGPLQWHQWAIQLIDKLLLNSASGIADGKWDTKVRVNNRAASMRIIGQLALTYLVYSVEPKGFYSTSTNTDGVYLTNDNGLTEKDINDEIEHWKERHHLGATPEIMEHFVSKDANNRFEQENDEERGTPAGGTIGNAFGANSKSKMSQPFVVDAGIIHYFKTHKNVCTTYDLPDNDLLEYLKQQQSIIVNATEYTDKVRNAMLSFCWPIQPKKNQAFVLEHPNAILEHFEKTQHVNRILLVNKGYKLLCYETHSQNSQTARPDEDLTAWCRANGIIDHNDISTKAYQYKISNMNKDWNVLRVNLDMRFYFGADVWKNLDLNAYLEFTKSKILGTKANPIWVEKKFEIPKYFDKMQRFLNDNIIKDIRHIDKE